LTLAEVKDSKPQRKGRTMWTVEQVTDNAECRLRANRQSALQQKQLYSITSSMWSWLAQSDLLMMTLR
jgi:hypothetical protein